MTNILLGKLSIFNYFVFLIPLLIVTGPFLPDFLLIILIFYYLINFKNINQIKFKNNFFYLFFIIYYLYICLLSLFSDSLIFSLKSSFFFIRYFFLILIIQYCIFNDEKFYKKINIVFSIPFLFIIFDAYFQYFFEFNTVGIKWVGRLSGFFSDEWILGSYIFNFFPIALTGIFLFFENNFKKSFIYGFIFLNISIYLVFLTGERVAFFSMIIVYFFYLFLFYFYFKKLKFYKYFITLFVILITCLIYFNTAQKDWHIKRTLNQFISKDKKQIYIFNKGYDEMYQTAFKMFKERPLFGYGNKMFRVKCKDLNFNVGKYSCSTHPHNFYLQVLAENGLIGFFFLVSLYIYIIKDFFYFFKSSYKSQNIKQYCIFFILLSLILNLFPFFPTGNLFNNSMALFLFYKIGFYLGLKSLFSR